MIRPFIPWCLVLVSVVTSAAANPLDLAALNTQLADPAFEVRKAAVKVFLAAGRERPLNEQEIDSLLLAFQTDPDWRIKVRITAALPLAADHDQVLAPLRTALRERDDKDSGGGNLQTYACKALAEIGDPRALPEMRGWLKYLKRNPTQFALLGETLIEHVEEHIRELEGKANEQRSGNTIGAARQ